MSQRETRLKFCWKIDYSICGKTIKEHKEEWHISQTQSLRQSILMSYETRMSNDVSDSLALNVKSRLERCDVAEVKYYHLCRT